jgi:CHRD domain/PEP-CTERM motif
MRTLTRYLAALAFVAALSCASAQAGIIYFTASLDASQVVDVVSTSTATGFATVAIDTDLFTITTDLSWSGLTGPADRSHMHDAPLGESRSDPPWDMFFHEVLNDADRTVTPCPWSGAVFTDCVPATGSTHDVLALSGPTDGYGYPDFASLVSVFMHGDVYIDMHTETYAPGEIRGQLEPVAPVPEPTSLVLLGLGSAGLASLRRRRQ